MPGLARKILIFAAIDGLVLQPLAQRGQRPAPASKIAYKDKSIALVLQDGVETDGVGRSFEAFGIVGLLTVSKSSFLVSITRRQQIAQIQGKPIYVITEVALTPLASRAEAELSISRTSASLLRRTIDGTSSDDSDSSDDEGGLSAGASDDVDDDDDHVNSGAAGSASPSKEQGSGHHKRSTSVAEDVITRKGSYGRFAQKWFSKKGWTVDQRRNLGMSVTESGADTPTPPTEAPTPSQEDSPVSEPSLEDVKAQSASDVAEHMLPKLLRTTQILFGSSRSFFFSYDYDITRSFANRRTTGSELPLHKEVDPLFFWNRSLTQPFIDSGHVSLVLPLMQGFIGQRTFTMDPHPPEPVMTLDGAGQSTLELTELSQDGHKAKPTEAAHSSPDKTTEASESKTEKPFMLTLISRRSVKRAGLRYLRRGVDEEGHTANCVETEQILSDPDWTASSKIYSFVQIRGSIPVFFSQSPYSFKPVPQLSHSEDFNFKAFKTHFGNLSERYGSVQVASLVEKHGNEAIVGDAYEKNMKRLNESGGVNGCTVGMNWFDFHAVCKGMHFENVSLLMDSLEDQLDAFGNSVEVDGKLLVKQSGVLRTNCMDCLDRTNVVQSACGRRALEIQLKCEGIDLSKQPDQSTSWFNTVWADNGDAISKQYASTAALKGDFTRTRKRNYKGALTDMGLSISRFYSGIVNDYFSQAAIDFLVGNVTSMVFEDFEANMMSGDPAVSMQKMRQQAIEISHKLVVADDHEEFIAGWTLLTPSESNTIRSLPFEESVLLLTDSALYACRFSWDTEKVSSFERINLQHILAIKYGTYVTSTLSAAQADEKRNVGFVLSYKAGADDIARVNTRSLSTVQPAPEHSDVPEPADGTYPTPPLKALTSLFQPPQPVGVPTKILAFKALSSRSALADDATATKISEIEQVMTICFDIERMVMPGRAVEAGSDKKINIVEEGDIISLAEARRSTTVFEQLGHSLKKMVWA
ncbi:hypothetical protein BP5796_11120 [Coleophoma crateriformis]|uniref:SAC domain-containing protein n=1 Tax=Coleophoma crateriformis TaxID=565419 RepID=A0A3D8QM98_9HELO|nr:hypothetical protein BP5796_11120 [Coleophoma crateriformis]